jgi:hypothetical protein
MRVSTFHSNAILRLGGTGLRRTKSPGGAAFEPCSFVLVRSFGHHGTSGSTEAGSRISGVLCKGGAMPGSPDGAAFGGGDMKLDQFGVRDLGWFAS